MTGNRLWTLGVIAVVFAVVVFGWLFAISPTLASADASRVQARTIEAQNIGTEKANTAQSEKLTKLPELQAELKALQLAMPPAQNLDDFFDEVATIAGASGVSVGSVVSSEAAAYGAAETAGGVTPGAATSTTVPSSSPSPAPSPAPSTGTGTANTSAQPAAAGNLFSIPITISVDGTLDQVMKFVNSMQMAPRMFALTAVSFTGGTTGPPKAMLKGSVFVVRDSTAASTTTAK